MKKTVLFLAALAIAGGASAQFAPQAVVAQIPDRMVRTVSAGDIPMLDDLSLVLLAGGTPEQAIAVRQASLWVDRGFWSNGATMGDASIRGYRRMTVADAQRRAKLIAKTSRYFLPVALAQVSLDQAGVQASFPVAIDGERFNLTPTNASVCAYGRTSCVVLDNVNLSQTIHRSNPGRPVMALKDSTTLLSRDAVPVYGLVVDIKPGVKHVDGRNLLVGSAVRGGFIDFTQCVHSAACGVGFEFDLSNGAGVAGFAK